MMKMILVDSDLGRGGLLNQVLNMRAVIKMKRETMQCLMIMRHLKLGEGL